MSDETDPSEIIEGKTKDSRNDSATPLRVINETRYLEKGLGKLLLEIYEHEGATVEQLSDKLDKAAPKISRDLAELRKQGYLGVNFGEESKQYYVRSDWSTQEFPSGPIIPLVYQYNLLSDRSRMEALYKAVQHTVDDGDVVADLGAGVGFLSCIASESAEKVYAIEIDREVYEEGKRVIEQNEIDNVEYIRGDAREVEIPEEVDVILCELLDTGLIAELQVPVMNYAMQEFASSDTKTVPNEARTTMQLIKSDYSFYDYEFRIPHFQEYGSRTSNQMSAEETYHSVSFDEQNSELVDKRVTLEATESGLVDGIQLNTEVQFAPEMEYTGASPWLNPPLNLPFNKEIEVSPGDTVTVEISYELGGGLSNIVYNVVDYDN